MQRDVTAKIKKLATLKDLSEGMAAQMVGAIEVSGVWTVCNRSKENTLLQAIAEAEEAVAIERQRAELQAKLAAGAIVWRKVSGEWMIQITGQDAAEGDIVSVTTKDGRTADVLIKKIVARNAEGIFARV